MKSRIALALLALTLSLSPLFAADAPKSCEMAKDAHCTGAACCTKDADCCKKEHSCKHEKEKDSACAKACAKEHKKS